MENRAQQFKPGDFSHGQVHEFLGAFGRQGGNPDLLQLAIEDQKLMERLVRFWQRGGYEATINQKNARAIMGKNFLGAEEAIERFKLQLSDQDINRLKEIPFSESVLREYKNTHILVADCGLSIVGVKTRVDRNLFYSKEDAWYTNQAFAQKESKPIWRLIRKDIVANSTNKTWPQQQSLLTEGEETPEARAMVYTIILNYLVNGNRLFPNIYARCSDLDSDGGRVDVGYFDSDGLYVNDHSDDDYYGDLGLAAARK
jgi:hypothetical protein